MSADNIKIFEWKLGRTGLLTLIAGVTILLCTSFLLGVAVGKNIETYPGKIASAPQHFLTAFLRVTKLADEQKTPPDKENSAHKDDLDLSFHDTLTSRKPAPIADLPTAENKRRDESVMVYQESKAPLALPLPKEDATPGKEEKAPAPSGAENKAKAADSSHVEPASFLIQVASLKDKSKAVQIHKTVVAMGYPSKIIKIDLKEKGVWHRVIATGFETKANAREAGAKIAKKVNVKCIVRAAGRPTEKKS